MAQIKDQSLVMALKSGEVYPFDSPHELYHAVLYRNILNLFPQKKKAFTLFKLEGKTYEEAAAELNISKHTIKEHLSLVVAAIKEYMEVNPQQWVTAVITMLIGHWLNSNY